MRHTEFDYPKMLSILQRHNVDFVVIGGVCAMLHGSSMMTADVDIVPSRTHENLERLEAALTELHAYYREHPPMRIVPNAERLNTTGHHLLMTALGALDVLGSVNGRNYEDLLTDTMEKEIDENLRITMVTLPMLIQLKTEANRAKDRQHLPILRRMLADAEGSANPSNE